HDLKAPLSIIIGYMQLLRNDLPKDDFQVSVMQKIESTIQKMGRIIDDLLLFARSYGKETVRYEPLNMQQIVEEVQQRLSPLIEKGNADVTLAENWPSAVGYAGWVEEVWMNYMTNALKYGGTPPHITVGADSQKGLVRFWVRDSGQGLNEEQQSVLFQPFQRLDQTDPDAIGLGLWICRRLIERQGGRVGVRSRPGEGSLFYFTLPMSNGSPAPQEDESG
ncbi:MAG: HAMP domain-containing histidine kinase, partial [Anaerolineae bacterium]|nr:HAMP domain-containing histidine kinase [Anaerolineae bacterium]